MAHAESKGIILADTKFEFGLTDDGELLLIDEMMTPDSSRYWPKDTYSPGGPQPSFDKQYVRDYLESIKWNKQPPVPSLPRRRRRQHARQVPGRLPPPHRPRTGHVPCRRRYRGLDACIGCSSSWSPRWSRRASTTRMPSASSRSRFIAEVVEQERRQPRRKAADTLGVHRNTLTRKIKELKIKRDPPAGAGAAIVGRGLRSQRPPIGPP